MKIKKQIRRLAIYIITCFLVLSGVSLTVAADDNSLESRLKEFNAPVDTAGKSATKKKALKSTSPKKSKRAKKLAKKSKIKTAKRSRFRRACYQSSTARLRSTAKAFQPSIRNSSHRYGVSEALIISIITAESCFSQRARSPKNAQGLMQLIPATAKRFGVKNAYIPSQNIQGGTRYLKFLLERFSGNLHLAIAAYNAGEGAVDRYSGIPPYRETREYVRRVMSVYRRLQDVYEKSAPVNRAKGQFRVIKSSNDYFIKPDYKWERKQKRISHLYKVSKKQRKSVCRDVSSQKLRRNSRLVQRANAMKRYYVSTKPQSLSAISKITGVSLGLLLRMNRGASKYMIKPGAKVLVWQCAKR